MSYYEAQALASLIRDETTVSMELRQVGNGEWIVLFDAGYRAQWIWSPEDWEQFKQREGLITVSA